MLKFLSSCVYLVQPEVPVASFQIGEDSDDDPIEKEDKAVQTISIETLAPLDIKAEQPEPRSLEECLAIFKSDVSSAVILSPLSICVYRS